MKKFRVLACGVVMLKNMSKRSITTGLQAVVLCFLFVFVCFPKISLADAVQQETPGCSETSPRDIFDMRPGICEGKEFTYDTSTIQIRPDNGRDERNGESHFGNRKNDLPKTSGGETF